MAVFANNSPLDLSRRKIVARSASTSLAASEAMSSNSSSKFFSEFIRREMSSNEENLSITEWGDLISAFNNCGGMNRQTFCLS